MTINDVSQGERLPRSVGKVFRGPEKTDLYFRNKPWSWQIDIPKLLKKLERTGENDILKLFSGKLTEKPTTEGRAGRLDWLLPAAPLTVPFPIGPLHTSLSSSRLFHFFASPLVALKRKPTTICSILLFNSSLTKALPFYCHLNIHPEVASCLVLCVFIFLSIHSASKITTERSGWAWCHSINNKEKK